jgi:4-aminobutyrate aminotransferase-like enzyme
MWGIDVVEPAAEIVGRALRAGLLVCSAGEYTVRLLPPLIAERRELERGLAILSSILE